MVKAQDILDILDGYCLLRGDDEVDIENAMYEIGQLLEATQFIDQGFQRASNLEEHKERMLSGQPSSESDKGRTDEKKA